MFLMIMVALLPNGLEYSLLVFEVVGQAQILPLYLVILLALFLPGNTRVSNLYPIAILVFGTAIGVSCLLTNDTDRPFARVIATYCYLVPILAARWTSYISEKSTLSRWYYFSIFTLLVSQGILVLIQTKIPALADLSYFSVGEEHRDSYGYYRFGSTIAAANTSGCLTALAIPAVVRLVFSSRMRGLVFCSAALAILGYQSRSGFLIFVILATLHYRKSISIRSVFLLIPIAALGVALLAFREADELASSGDYRTYLAIEAWNLILQADVTELLIGYGPGAALSRDLAPYYGHATYFPPVLLSSSESFLLLSLVEIGLLGTVSFLFLIWENTKSLVVFLAILIYFALDPSFSRCFEAFLVMSLVCGIAPKKRRVLAHRSLVNQRLRLHNYAAEVR
jgi:hypothetical protein